MADDDPWFAEKTFGYGAGLPLRWQGWAMMLAHVAVILSGLPLAKTHPFAFALYALVIALIPMPIYAAKTRGGWKWRWGGDR